MKEGVHVPERILKENYVISRGFLEKFRRRQSTLSRQVSTQGWRSLKK